MVKINLIEIENSKRIKAFKATPSADGLTVIGGKNGQGKTSVLDTIAWALGGDKYRPSQPMREGSVLPPYIHIVLSNGLVVERKGKNSELKVSDPAGKKGGQQILNELISQLALDLPRFIQSSSKEKAQTLLQIIGVGDQLAELERKENELYQQRLYIGRIADQKTKFAREMTAHPDAPKDLVSASELIQQQQEILARNGENQRKRQQLAVLESEADELERKIAVLQERQAIVLADLDTARKSALDLQDESTAELEKNIMDIERINVMVRANLDKEKAEDDALQHQNQYNTLTAQIDDTRAAKMALLAGSDLPLAGLSVENGELTYNGYSWDNMASSDQMKVAAAIVRKLNPNCGFVLMDKLEQMDTDTLREFGAWLEQEGLQVIATRVGTDGDCSIIIEDGYAYPPGETKQEAEPQPETEWKAGVF